MTKALYSDIYPANYIATPVFFKNNSYFYRLLPVNTFYRILMVDWNKYEQRV